MLNDQRGTSDNLFFSRVFNDRHKIVSAGFHPVELTQELRVRNVADAGELRQQFQKTSIDVTLL